MPTATAAHETFFINVAGKKTQVTRGGEGPPLLYLHSAGGEADWTPFHALLAEHFTLYVPAHTGFALSEGLDEIDDIYDLAWHTIDLMDELGLKRIPIVGFSLGAWLAAEIAILRPELASKLVFVAAAGLRVEGAPVAELFNDNFDVMRHILFYDPDGPLVEEVMPIKIEDERILNWLRAREATARVAWNPYLHNPRLPRHLHRITCPTLILWGRHDRLIPVAHGEYYAKHLPNAELKIFEQCGHVLPFEAPREFAEEVRRFVLM